ncbi:MAG: IcmS [uncultured bacterium]|nr:MAG: IcmS [uncultured bacterium]
MDLTRALCNLVKTTNAKFTFCGKSISCEEAFAETGLLPAIAQRADKMCSLCLGYGIGATFIEAEKSLLGVQVQFDDITPDTLRLMYIYDVILGIIGASPKSDQVPFDELLYD